MTTWSAPRLARKIADLLDVERLAEFLGQQLDHRLIADALDELVGQDDERAIWWATRSR